VRVTDIWRIASLRRQDDIQPTSLPGETPEANGWQTSFLQSHRSHAPQRSFGHNRPRRGGLAQLAATVAAAVAPALLIQAFLVQPLRHIRKYVLATVFVGIAIARRVPRPTRKAITRLVPRRHNRRDRDVAKAATRTVPAGTQKHSRRSDVRFTPRTGRGVPSAVAVFSFAKKRQCGQSGAARPWRKSRQPASGCSERQGLRQSVAARISPRQRCPTLLASRAASRPAVGWLALPVMCIAWRASAGAAGGEKHVAG
jgi:hypothetical protein